MLVNGYSSTITVHFASQWNVNFLVSHLTWLGNGKSPEMVTTSLIQAQHTKQKLSTWNVVELNTTSINTGAVVMWYRRWKNGPLASRLSESIKVIGTETDLSKTYDFLLVIDRNHGSFSYRFRDKRRFYWKITNFISPVYLTFPYGVLLDARKSRMTPYKKVRKACRCAHSFRRSTCAGQTDRHYRQKW